MQLQSIKQAAKRVPLGVQKRNLVWLHLPQHAASYYQQQKVLLPDKGTIVRVYSPWDAKVVCSGSFHQCIVRIKVFWVDRIMGNNFMAVIWLAFVWFVAVRPCFVLAAKVQYQEAEPPAEAPAVHH
eukprot:NODE_750_length_710_cov_103.623298_g683_i0.p1 GENE.NODE_750_length_710_cov_103.623298_g683_i0~~NODE_750_length_710_cov_103.623298_g683_i0.p1  ORF type:complete len:126 (+),score=25.24 NODE_750_length_710_cov_103.623298_g683_i0:60-437(+)